MGVPWWHSGLRIQRCHELWVDQRRSWDLVWLWLWRSLGAAAPVRPLAWELLHATGAALKRKEKKKKKES